MSVLIEQAVKTGEDTVYFYNNGAISIQQSLAQSFSPVTNISCSSLSLYLAWLDTLPDGEFKISLRSVSQTGTILGSGTFNGSDLSIYPTFAWKEVTFSSVALTSGTTYYITLERTAEDVPPIGAFVYAGLAGNLYANGVMSKFDGSSWSNIALQDLTFRVSFPLAPPVPSGLNAMSTIKRLVCAAANKIWYET